ncbi:MAG: LD-carboxypeptidase [Alphaproteobacteria bacterium]|nr:LD-carboxypeptidase [Alphaproteobacteria bacterium]
MFPPQKKPQAALFPDPLKPGGTVGIISPACWAPSAYLDKLQDFLEGHGYGVVIHAQNYRQEGLLAGSAAARAEAVMDMFADTTIDAVMCARGGIGSGLILDLLDYDLIAETPKPLIGFSDITALLHAVTKRSGFVTYHGPMGWNFSEVGNDARTGSDLLTVTGALSENNMKMHYAGVDGARPGKAEGVLWGGNIALLQTLIGTPYDWSGDGAILFFEETEEPLRKLDRMLNHFRLAGKFKGVRAVLVGEMIDITDDETPYGRNVREIVLAHVPPDVPLCFNFPCGHGAYATTLPMGARAQLTLDARAADLTYRTSS